MYTYKLEAHKYLGTLTFHRLHDKMFECVSQSPMSFFHINPSGRILNRFSKDMGSVDELLPQAMIDCFQVNTSSS